MIGIGGIGMSALARLFLHDKKKVSGSDRAITPIISGLEALGATVFGTQTAQNITKDIDCVVYTEAMSEDNEEMIAARALGVPMMNYFEALGLVANQYYLIAVAGTHGKTTTTAMLTDVFEGASLDPTVIVGSLRSKTGSNFRPGKSKYCIVEACEYRRDFLSLRPDVLIITNIEAEHLDYFKNLADVQSAFRELVSNINDGGVVVANPGDPTVLPALSEATATVVDYTKYLDPLLELTQPGMHNRMNAAAAIAAAAQVGIQKDVASEALKQFAGTWRRFEYKGEFHGAKVYDDYGHHPTEIKVTLRGTRELFPNKKIIAVFQPHLQSRLEKLFDDFTKSFHDADQVVLVPAYRARKEVEGRRTSRELATGIVAEGGTAEYFETFEEVARYLETQASSEVVIVVTGAGDIAELATLLAKGGLTL